MLWDSRTLLIYALVVAAAVYVRVLLAEEPWAAATSEQNGKRIELGAAVVHLAAVVGVRLLTSLERAVMRFHSAPKLRAAQGSSARAP